MHNTESNARQVPEMSDTITQQETNVSEDGITLDELRQ